MNHSMPGLPVHQQHPGFDSNSSPLSQWCHSTISSPSPPALNLFQDQGVFQWVPSDGQNVGVSASTSVLPINTQDTSPLGWTGRPGMLWFMRSWRVGHYWATELNWIHFHFIFVYDVRECSNFFLLQAAVQFSLHHLLKRLFFFSIIYSCLLCCRLIDLKSFYTAKETINKTKRPRMDWEKIFANDATKKGLIFKIAHTTHYQKH